MTRSRVEGAVTMQASEFIRVAGETFDTWLRKLARWLADGTLEVVPDSYSFPRMLRVAETPDHFIAELCGAIRPRHPTNVRLQRPKQAERWPSATAFFNAGFNIAEAHQAMVIIHGSNNAFEDLTLATPYDKEVFLKKVNFPLSRPTVYGCVSDTPLGILPTADRLYLLNVNLVRTDDFRVLFRTILTAICVKKDVRPADLRTWIGSLFQESLKRRRVIGLNLGNDASAIEFGRQLASFSDQNVGEAILDRFIQTHGDQFENALNYRSHLSQPTLHWIARDANDPQQSIPDYLLQRHDGYWDILDLKRAALRFKSIVHGLPARPRFIAYVGEMIAQLVLYQRYFDNPINAKWAKDNLGVCVDKPTLVGLVGNYDTFIQEEVELAMKQYRDNLAILSYSDVINLLRAADRAKPASQ